MPKKKKEEKEEKEREPEYEPSPFNYCDYRCDRCEHQDTCKVFKDDQERLLQHYLKGEDPYDPEIFMNDLKEIFDKTKNMVIDLAEKEGIELDDIPDEEVPRVDPHEYVIYQLAREYCRTAHDFIKHIDEEGVPESLKEEFSDFVWHHTLIPAKTGRLVSGFVDGLRDEELSRIEEAGTLGVIKKGIDLSKNALDLMLNELPDDLHSIAELLNLLSQLEKQIQKDIRQKVEHKITE
jgi:hypothetical protein